MPLTPAWCPEAAKPSDIIRISDHGTDVDLGLYPGLGQQHGPRTPTQSPVASLATLVLRGGSIQKVSFSSSHASLVVQEAASGAEFVSA